MTEIRLSPRAWNLIMGGLFVLGSVLLALILGVICIVIGDKWL